MRPGPRLVPFLCLGLAAAVLAGVLLPGSGGGAAAWVLSVSLLASALAVRGRLPEELLVEVSGPAVLIHNRPAERTLTIRGGPHPLRVEIALDPSDALELGLPRGRLLLPAGGALQLPLAITGRRRGRATLGPARLWVGDTLGLWERRVSCPLGEVTVHPRAAATSGLRTRRLGSGSGRPRPVPGAGSEFRSLRPYVPGDDPRAIHWPATARLGTLISRTWSGEEAPRVLLAVDSSRRMSAADGPAHSRLDRAVEAALGLAAELGSAPVGAVAFDRRVLREVPPARRGLAAVRRALSDLQPTPYEPDYAELFRHLRDRVRRRTLVVLLTSPEGDDGLARALPLLVDRHRVLVAAAGDRSLRALAGLTPDARRLEDLEHLHARSSALLLLDERRRCLARIRAAGAAVLDADASELERSLRAHFLRLISAGPV